MKQIYRTTIHIWTKDLTDNAELVDLAQAATDGAAICTWPSPARSGTSRASSPPGARPPEILRHPGNNRW